MMESSSDAFCTGPGRVMMSGFQSSKGGNCVLYLFQGAVVDTEAKYVVAIVSTVAMGAAVELIRHVRALVRRRLATVATSPLVQDVVSGVLYAVQMTLAYWLMLLVMLYESGLFVAVVGGLAVGHVVTAQLQRKCNRPGGGAFGGASGGPRDTLPLLLPTASPCCGDGH